MFKRSKRILLILKTVWQQQLLLLFYPYFPAMLQKMIKNIYGFRFIFNQKSQKFDNLLINFNQNRGQYLRQTLEALGPIFIKLGQMISTRADLIPYDIGVELNKLQDRVPGFAFTEVKKIIEKQFNQNLDMIYQSFDEVPTASASMAQVHFATLKDGQEVAVKVLRPHMKYIIDTDIALMYDLAKVLNYLIADARRLKLKQTIHELEKHLHHELDLMREAANASQLKRNMQKHANTRDLIHIPEIYFDQCRTQVLTMERMKGIGVAKTHELQEASIDLKKLARDGVEIFFSQVFRDGFFHADMHPGNILVDNHTSKGRYIALDFGIMGTLSEFDKHYLAHNFLAFFERDYHRVAQLHVESEWVPKNTNIEELEAAIRTCCEPYFDKPLKEISLGVVLMRLFQTSREFHVEIQPQLTMLQKTLLNIEGLGRQLDPDLDLWKTAKPILKKWMNEQVGYKSFLRHLKSEGLQWGKIMPQLPRLIHEKLVAQPDRLWQEQQRLAKAQEKTNRYLWLSLLMMSIFMISAFIYIANFILKS